MTELSWKTCKACGNDGRIPGAQHHLCATCVKDAPARIVELGARLDAVTKLRDEWHDAFRRQGKLLSSAQVEINALKTLLGEADKHAPQLASVFGCSACGSDHRILILQPLRRTTRIGNITTDRAVICPETGIAVYFDAGSAP